MAEVKQPTWQFHNEAVEDSTSKPSQPSKSQTANWTASEFIHHDKGSDWYLMLIIGGAIITVFIYLVTKDVMSAAMILIAAVVFGVFAGRKPRVLEYQVDNTGLRIGQKFYSYANFKSFALVSEDSINSIWLMPLKRFMPIITVYFAPDDEHRILDVISNFLPVQNHQPDPIDKLMHKLRF